MRKGVNVFPAAAAIFPSPRLEAGGLQKWRSRLNVEQLYRDREKLAYLAELLPRFPGTGINYLNLAQISGREPQERSLPKAG
jgi:hypothetical protein